MSEKNFNRFLDAIKSNDLAAVEADYLPEFIDKSESGGMYPVHLACSKKSFEVFKFLMKNKCNIESVDNKGHRPIHYAIESGAEEIVKLLIGSLCDLSDYNDLLKMAEKLSERSTEIKEILEKSNENRKTGVEMELDCNVDCNHKFCLISFTLNEFSKEHFLETGSFSKVFKVVESRKNRVFAVKKIILRDVENTKLIENNINNFMKKLDNKHIVKYFGSLRENYKMFIFMEYLPGGSISNLILTEFPDGLHHDKIIKYSQHILQGLDYLHKSLIIHRDVKPANILLDENDDCKLIDFGLSRLIESGYPSTFCGTLYYMSPEIINEEPYSCTSDIWSVGATVVEMLTGKPPYSDLSQIQIIFKIVQEKKITYKAKNPPSETLSRFIAKLLSPLPSDRGTADELLKSDIFSKNVKK